MVVIGGMGGALKTGQYVDDPECGRKGRRTAANVSLTPLHPAGAKRDLFGGADPDPKDVGQSGPLSELLA